MRKQVFIALAVVLVALISVAVWQLLRSQVREPVYQGKTLSNWLERYSAKGSYIGLRPEPVADEAVRQIGTNSIPTLLHKLRAHDSKLKLALLRLSDEQHFIRFWSLPAFFPTRQAAVAFHALGAQASNAVPFLIQTYREKIGSDSQCGCAEALGWIGPAASEAIPDLMSAATDSDNTLRAIAVEALGNIHADPALVLPVLIKSLQDSNGRVRLNAVNALAAFGSEAKAAVPALTRSLNDPVPIIRTNAATSLKAIDPAAAAKAGTE